MKLLLTVLTTITLSSVIINTNVISYFTINKQLTITIQTTKVSVFAEFENYRPDYLIFDKARNLYCTTWKNKIYKISEVN